MFALFRRAATKNNAWPYSNAVKAFITIVVALFLAVAFFSHNATDYSWFYYDTMGKSITNWAGAFGAQCAALFFYLFGSACCVLVVLASFIAYFFLSKKRLKDEWARIAAYFLCMGTLATLFAMHEIDFLSSTTAGGYCGRNMSFMLQNWFGNTKIYLLLYSFLLILLIIIVRFSFVSVARTISAFFSKQKKRIPSLPEIPLDTTVWKELIAYKKKSIIADAPPTSTSADAQPIHYQLPNLDLFITVDQEHADNALLQELEKRSKILQEKLERFDIYGKVTAIKRGPVVTLFEYQPHIDTKISKIIALEDDLALALQATSIRIIAPIPGKSLVGFEVANKSRKNVLLATLIKTEAYTNTQALLPIILGVDTIGATVVADLAKMPHLLMAGSTGSGKSVALNAMVISLLCKKSPEEVRLIIIDPKRLEFVSYADIAHLLFPIVTDPKVAPSVLRWLVKQMEERYAIMAAAGTRNIHDYQQQHTNMPYIVVIIDELADLMMCAGKEVEDSIIRITQMARAAGIHLIAATQRPSVDVITGLIKVNFPSRISFRVTSKIDSRTILDSAGADKLLGRGDMLFLDAHDSVLKRIHGAYVLDKEIQHIMNHIKSQRASDYLDIKQVCSEDRSGQDSQKDSMYDQICQFIAEVDEVSISLLQRRFRIGYNRSARIIDMLESEGLIAPSYGGKTRKVIR